MTFTHTSLWDKSKVYIDRALTARDHRDADLFHLWAAVALELLGKAALAHISPALVADPQHFPSLLASCGGKSAPNTKSIAAKTVFERLTDASQEFDDKMKRECLTMADRRNAELHSGETPSAGLDPKTWVPAFWRACNVMVRCQAKTLVDWLGKDEAASVAQILADAAKLTVATVTSRIKRRQQEFDVRYPLGSKDRQQITAQAEVSALHPRYLSIGDTHEPHPCPACKCKAWLFGFEWGSEVIDSSGVSDDFDHYFEIVATTYGVEQLVCAQCNLFLEGREEIDAAHLPLELTRHSEREPDYEPDYGNE